MNIGLYNDNGDIHVIPDVVITDKSENTVVKIDSIPADFGPVKAIFVNEGEHAYAKVRFDQESTNWFTNNLHKV